MFSIFVALQIIVTALDAWTYPRFAGVMFKDPNYKHPTDEGGSNARGIWSTLPSKLLKVGCKWSKKEIETLK